jgi:ketosteroid isomerase-like protein
MRNAAVVGMLLLAAIGSTPAQRRTDPKLDEIAAAFAAAFNRGDAASITAFYTDDAVLMPPNLPAVKGRSEIETYYRNGFSRSSGTVKIVPSESRVDGSIAFEAGSSSMTTGSPPRTETGKYLVIYRLVGNEWKMAYDIFNND